MSSPVLAEPSRSEQLSALQQRLGHRFESADLLEDALRHRSWCAENGGVPSNERLEFLGDAVLQLVITERLYGAEPGLAEGILTPRRAALVNSRTLAGAARRIELGGVIRLGRGETSTGGADKESILADATEAVIGAVYLDAGYDAARGVIERILAEDLERVESGRDVGDAKSRLQELAAHELDAVPRYEVTGSGPEHERAFHAVVRLSPVGAPRTAVEPTVWGEGTGRTKKEAEQAAALVALNRLVDEGKLNDEHT